MVGSFKVLDSNTLRDGKLLVVGSFKVLDGVTL